MTGVCLSVCLSVCVSVSNFTLKTTERILTKIFTTYLAVVKEKLINISEDFFTVFFNIAIEIRYFSQFGSYLRRE